MPRMPLEHHRDPRRGWFIVHVAERLDIDETIQLIRTLRSSVADRMVPMIVDARDVRGRIADQDIERAVAAVREAVRVGGPRGHVAIATDDDGLYASMLRYEAACAEIGVQVIRVFRQLPDAEEWLEIISATRDFS
jgi:hypothetical protein